MEAEQSTKGTGYVCTHCHKEILLGQEAVKLKRFRFMRLRLGTPLVEKPSSVLDQTYYEHYMCPEDGG